MEEDNTRRKPRYTLYILIVVVVLLLILILFLYLIRSPLIFRSGAYSSVTTVTQTNTTPTLSTDNSYIFASPLRAKSNGEQIRITVYILDDRGMGMSGNGIPAKTMNRRLSTLRHLSRFLQASHAIDHDFTEGIENVSTNIVKKTHISPISNEFKAYLVNKKVSANTIKNYLSDIRHFLSWLETNPQPLNTDH